MAAAAAVRRDLSAPPSDYHEPSHGAQPAEAAAAAAAAAAASAGEGCGLRLVGEHVTLEREKAVFKEAPTAQPELKDHSYIIERQLKPEARTDIIRELADLEIKPTSMIDISDGLASECLHIVAASGVGVRVYEEKLPMDPKTYDTARDFNLDPTVCMLSGGEDYELLFTVHRANILQQLFTRENIPEIGTAYFY